MLRVQGSRCNPFHGRGLGAGLALVLAVIACRQEPRPPSTRPASPVAEDADGTEWPADSTTRGLTDGATPELAAERAPAATASAPSAQGGPREPRGPLADAVVGERCRYRVRDGQVEELRVVRVDAGLVSIELKMYRDGKPLGLPAIRIERADEDPVLAHAARRNANVAVGDETITAAGRAWPCRVLTETWVDEEVTYIRRTWRCDAVPVYGIVRMEMTADGAPTASMDLIDCGSP